MSQQSVCFHFQIEAHPGSVLEIDKSFQYSKKLISNFRLEKHLAFVAIPSNTYNAHKKRERKGKQKMSIRLAKNVIKNVQANRNGKR